MTRSGPRQEDNLTTTLTTAGAIEINRPVQRVFDFVTDMTNDTLWRSDITSMIAVDDTPLSVGKVFREKIGLLEADVLVTTLEPARRMRCHARILFGLLHVEISNRFEPTADGTRFHKRLDFDIRRLGWLLRPLLKRRLASPEALHLDALKHLLESEPSS